MSDTKIRFHFHPLDWENKGHVIEKSENGVKRKYLKGISSGINIDGHGERMTPNCIKSFSEQAKSGDVLLFPDIHGIRGTDDIGILVDHEVDKGGNWVTEYRLYDELDDMGSTTIEKAVHLWKQMNGLPPYSKPRQKGFSIEGSIPEGGIVQMSADGRRVIDAVDLDGVVVVPRPAYKDSIAHACYKALGEEAPWVVQKDFQGILHKELENSNLEEAYFLKRYQLDDTLHKAINNIMVSNSDDKVAKLGIIFDEYKSLMTDLVTKSRSIFVAGGVSFNSSDLPSGNRKNKDELFKEISNEMSKLMKSLSARR